MNGVCTSEPKKVICLVHGLMALRAKIRGSSERLMVQSLNDPMITMLAKTPAIIDMIEAASSVALGFGAYAP